jgi:transposase
MDNAVLHRNGRIKEIVKAKGCHLIYLPPYSPDLNPIKKGFSVLKANLRQYGQLDGGVDDGDQIQAFAKLFLTSHLMKGLFQGSGYIDYCSFI